MAALSSAETAKELSEQFISKFEKTAKKAVTCF